MDEYVIERRSAVGAVYEAVNEWAGESRVPSSAEEGWMRDQKRNCEATEIRADGVVLVQFHHIFDQHHPGARQEMGHPSGLC